MGHLFLDHRAPFNEAVQSLLHQLRPAVQQLVVAEISLFRGRNTWPLFSLWLSSKVTAAWSRWSLSAASPMPMAIPSVTENSTPHASPERR